MAVSKENGQVIEKIKSLEDSDQRDIMFYIQNTLAAMSTSAIANGDMTSGKDGEGEREREREREGGEEREGVCERERERD